MVSIAGTEIPLPSFSGLSAGTITILLVIFIVFVGLAIAIYMFHIFRVYNKKIVVYENIAGQGFQEVWRDRARLIKIGDGGEELMYLLKKKVFRTAYGKKMGKNLYWFAIGQDGYWYNCVLGDLDAKMGMLDIEPIDRDMRYMHVAVRKNTQERYRKLKFMEKFGGVVISFILILVILIGMWFLLDKMGDIAGNINQGIEASVKVQDATANILSGLDNIVGGGSGIQAVT